MCGPRSVRKFLNGPSAIKCHSIGAHLSLREPGLRSRYTDYVTAWITEESWLDSRQENTTALQGTISPGMIGEGSGGDKVARVEA